MAKSTILSISKSTGFSVSTVSKVLSGKAKKSRISIETIKKIEDEAKKCNYTPSLLARSLRTNKTNMIGLIVPSIDNPFFSNLSSIIVKEAKKRGYTIILADTAENEASEIEYIDSLISRNLDGLIVVPCGSSSKKLELVNTKTPVVLVDRYYIDTSLQFVSTDNYIGAKLALQYFYDNGHKNIACIQGPKVATPVMNRIEGYTEFMKQHGLDKYICIEGNSFSIENGYIETKKILNKKNRPTAIFALSNTIGLGAYKAIKEMGLNIPNDISIICFDNYHYLDYLNPSMTRIAQPIDKIGLMATKTLIDSIENKNSDEDKSPIQVLLKPDLIIKDSVLNIQ